MAGNVGKPGGLVRVWVEGERTLATKKRKKGKEKRSERCSEARRVLDKEGTLRRRTDEKKGRSDGTRVLNSGRKTIAPNEWGKAVASRRAGRSSRETDSEWLTHRRVALVSSGELIQWSRCNLHAQIVKLIKVSQICTDTISLLLLSPARRSRSEGVLGLTLFG